MTFAQCVDQITTCKTYHAFEMFIIYFIFNGTNHNGAVLFRNMICIFGLEKTNRLMSSSSMYFDKFVTLIKFSSGKIIATNEIEHNLQLLGMLHT